MQPKTVHSRDMNLFSGNGVVGAKETESLSRNTRIKYVASKSRSVFKPKIRLKSISHTICVLDQQKAQAKL